MQHTTSIFSFRSFRRAVLRTGWRTSVRTALRNGLCAGVFRACILPAAALCCGAPLADTLVVPTDFDTIQGALAAARSGDNIIVEPGTYRGNLDLVENVEVRGRETARTLIGPVDPEIATVTIANASGARLGNVTLIDSSIGVSVTGSSAVDVFNVVFDRSGDTGLSADAVSSVEATNNVFFGNETAISRGSTIVLVENNIFVGSTTTIETVLLTGVDPLANILSNCFFANDDAQEGDLELGVGATFGDPLFVDPAGRDFHLREDSPCIDAGRGTDAIDGSTADAGAYGGPLADPLPFPVEAPELSDASTTAPPALNIAAAWSPNLSYRVTNTENPGGYRVYYKQGGEPVPPFDGTDAGGGMLPSPIDVGNVTTYTIPNLAPQAVAPPLAPRLLSASGRNESAILTWEAVEGATGYRVHYGVGSIAENAVDTGNVTSFTVTGLANETTYRFAVSAINQPAYHVAVTAVDNTQNRNESAITEASTIAIGTPLESPLSSELTATPGAVQPFPDLPDEGCFIATAAYGAEWVAEVQVLRAFRDRFLLTHPPGRRLVRQYYTHGPAAAAYLNEHEALKPLVRAALLPLVALALLLLDPLTPAAALLALLALRREFPDGAGAGNRTVARREHGGRRR